VFAGHNQAGERCQCGTDGCTCDPGDPGFGNYASPSPVDNGPAAQPTPADRDQPSDFNPVAGVLVLVAVLLWSRMRV